MYFDEDTQEEIDEVRIVMEAHIEANVAKFITGARDLAEFDAFVKELEDLGLRDLEEIYQAAYEAYLAAKELLKAEFQEKSEKHGREENSSRPLFYAAVCAGKEINRLPFRKRRDRMLYRRLFLPAQHPQPDGFLSGNPTGESHNGP